jgi:hypothetical protein
MISWIMSLMLLGIRKEYSSLPRWPDLSQERPQRVLLCYIHELEGDLLEGGQILNLQAHIAWLTCFQVLSGTDLSLLNYPSLSDKNFASGSLKFTTIRVTSPKNVILPPEQKRLFREPTLEQTGFVFGLDKVWKGYFANRRFEIKRIQ